MRPITKIINKTLSVRLSLMVVAAMTILLMASLFVLLHFSRRTIKDEALRKASQTLECTTEHIDNILLSIEQATGNIYYNLRPEINNQDMVRTSCRQLVESNPYIVGAAIAMKPGYYNDGKNFMAYFHRELSDTVLWNDSPILQLKLYNNQPYVQQAWYKEPMSTNKPTWMVPLEDMDTHVEPIITFCLPIPGDDGKPIGIIGADMSLRVLSKIVLEGKPSANSYCTLLDSDASFIVHPNGERLLQQSAFTISRHAADPTIKEAIRSMLSGETGYKSFTMKGTTHYVFYKPFTRMVVPGRSTEDLGWSIGIIYPEDDIFGDYNDLSYYVIIIAIVGLLIIFLLSRAIIHRQLLPLRLLTASAQRITRGNYTEPIPDSRQEDEIGKLQNNFQHMQQSLANNIGQLEQLQTTLQEHEQSLRKAYNHAQKADRMKTTFLHNMTNQMTKPALTIGNDVHKLCKDNANINELVDEIQENGKTIAEILNNIINASDEQMRKEVDHD